MTKRSIARALAQDRLQHDVALERAETALAREIDLRHAAGREVADHLVTADPHGAPRSGLRRHHYERIDGATWCVKPRARWNRVRARNTIAAAPRPSGIAPK